VGGVESGGGLFDEEGHGLADLGEGGGFFHFLHPSGGRRRTVTAIGNGFLKGPLPLQCCGFWHRGLSQGVEILLAFEDGLGSFLGLLQEVILVVVLAIFNGAKESNFLWIFGDFSYVFILEQGFAHPGEVAAFGANAGFPVVLGVGEIEFGGAFTTEAAGCDVFVELVYDLLVVGTLVVTRE